MIVAPSFVYGRTTEVFISAIACILQMCIPFFPLVGSQQHIYSSSSSILFTILPTSNHIPAADHLPHYSLTNHGVHCTIIYTILSVLCSIQHQYNKAYNVMYNQLIQIGLDNQDTSVMIIGNTVSLDTWCRCSVGITMLNTWCKMWSLADQPLLCYYEHQLGGGNQILCFSSYLESAANRQLITIMQSLLRSIFAQSHYECLPSS